MAATEEVNASSLDERDALLSFQLRGRLSEIDFGLIWQVMPSLGWKYVPSSGEYMAPTKPTEKNLGTAKAAMEKLDICALQCLQFRQNSKDQQQKSEDEPLSNLVDIRKDLLTAIFRKCKELEKPLPCFYFDNSDGEEEDSEGEEAKKVSRPRIKKDRSNNRDQSQVTASKSATANEPGTEAYFERKSKGKKQQPTTDIKITTGEASHEPSARRLKWPSPRDCVSSIRSGSEHQESQRQKVVDEYLDEFSLEWKFLLNTNHSLLLHGFGSKKHLLNKFASIELRPDGDVLTLNGYDPKINISQILDIVVQLFLNGVDPSPIPLIQLSGNSDFDNINHLAGLQTPRHLTSHIVQRALSISIALGMRHPKPIYLVIHNIDGVGLRSDDAQRALSTLVAYSSINDGSGKGRDEFQNDVHVVRLVASVDQVDAPLFLWDMETSNNFSWIWKEVNTGYPYFDEIEMGINEESRKMKTTEKQVLDFVFMKKVLKSVAPKHTAILKVLANMQLEHGKEHASLKRKHDFVLYKKWKNKCFNESFVVTKSDEFQSMVKELSDHNMIYIEADVKAGIDYVCIPTNKSQVQEILKSFKNSR